MSLIKLIINIFPLKQVRVFKVSKYKFILKKVLKIKVYQKE